MGTYSLLLRIASSRCSPALQSLCVDKTPEYLSKAEYQQPGVGYDFSLHGPIVISPQSFYSQVFAHWSLAAGPSKQGQPCLGLLGMMGLWHMVELLYPFSLLILRLPCYLMLLREVGPMFLFKDRWDASSTSLSWYPWILSPKWVNVCSNLSSRICNKWGHACGCQNIFSGTATDFLQGGNGKDVWVLP